MNKDSKNKDAAFQWMMFITSYEAGKYSAQTMSYFGARLSIYSDADLVKSNPWAEVFLEASKDQDLGGSVGCVRQRSQR